jgi:hypothetical protein
MAYRTTIVCLANSRKMGERCIAGREFLGGKFGRWIRPVSDRPHEELRERERLYAGRLEPAVLDIIGIEMLAPRPHDHQQENHLIDKRRRWARLGTVSWDRLAAAVDYRVGSLWLNGYSSLGGLNDRIPEDALHQVEHSLVLVRPDHVTLSGAAGDVRAKFALDGCDYRLKVTDPVVESRMATMEGDLTVQNAYLCVSLGEPFRAVEDQPTYAYKLVATVITPRRNRAA